MTRASDFKTRFLQLDTPAEKPARDATQNDVNSNQELGASSESIAATELARQLWRQTAEGARELQNSQLAAASSNVATETSPIHIEEYWRRPGAEKFYDLGAPNLTAQSTAANQNQSTSDQPSIQPLIEMLQPLPKSLSTKPMGSTEQPSNGSAQTNGSARGNVNAPAATAPAQDEEEKDSSILGRVFSPVTSLFKRELGRKHSYYDRMMLGPIIIGGETRGQVALPGSPAYRELVEGNELREKNSEGNLWAALGTEVSLGGMVWAGPTSLRADKSYDILAVMAHPAKKGEMPIGSAVAEQLRQMASNIPLDADALHKKQYTPGTTFVVRDGSWKQAMASYDISGDLPTPLIARVGATSSLSMWSDRIKTIDILEDGRVRVDIKQIDEKAARAWAGARLGFFQMRDFLDSFNELLGGRSLSPSEAAGATLPVFDPAAIGNIGVSTELGRVSKSESAFVLNLNDAQDRELFNKFISLNPEEATQELKKRQIPNAYFEGKTTTQTDLGLFWFIPVRHVFQISRNKAKHEGRVESQRRNDKLEYAQLNDSFGGFLANLFGYADQTIDAQYGEVVDRDGNRTAAIGLALGMTDPHFWQEELDVLTQFAQSCGIPFTADPLPIHEKGSTSARINFSLAMTEDQFRRLKKTSAEEALKVAARIQQKIEGKENDPNALPLFGRDKDSKGQSGLETFEREWLRKGSSLDEDRSADPNKKLKKDRKYSEVFPGRTIEKDTRVYQAIRDMVQGIEATRSGDVQSSLEPFKSLRNHDTETLLIVLAVLRELTGGPITEFAVNADGINFRAQAQAKAPKTFDAKVQELIAEGLKP